MLMNGFAGSICRGKEERLYLTGLAGCSFSIALQSRQAGQALGSRVHHGGLPVRAGDQEPFGLRIAFCISLRNVDDDSSRRAWSCLYGASPSPA